MTVLVECCFGWEVRKLVPDVDVDKNPLWASALVHSHRSQCVEAYRSLIRAGADEVIAPTFQASVWGLKKYLGLSEKEALDFYSDCIAVCREAIALEEKDQGKKLNIPVIGAMGPYGTHLHDGSEYTGIYPEGVDEAELSKWHIVQINALIGSGADRVVMGPCPRLDEALVYVKLLQSLPTKVEAWVSFSTKGEGKISSGENFVEVASKVWDAAKGCLLGIGINCCHAEIALELGRNLQAARPDIPYIPIPNSGEKYDTDAGRWVEKSQGKSLPEYIPDFLDLGVKWIGCCCRNYAKDMAAVRKKIDEYKSK